MKKLFVEVNVCESIRDACNAVASSVKKIKALNANLKTLIEDMILANVEQGFEIPVKGTEEARSSFKELLVFVYPKIASKLQKDYTEVESLRYKSLNFAWNSSITPAAKDVASDIDCYTLNKVLIALNIGYEDVNEIPKLVKLVKNFADPKEPEGIARFNEALQSAESSRKSQIDLLILEEEEKIEKLRAEREKVSEEFAIG